MSPYGTDPTCSAIQSAGPRWVAVAAPGASASMLATAAVVRQGHWALCGAHGWLGDTNRAQLLAVLCLRWRLAGQPDVFPLCGLSSHA